MMKCGLYDESYKIAADTNLLVNYLYNCHLKVAYLPEFVTRMRMGGMSTDSAKRKKVWDEDIRVYSGYGFKPVTLMKLMKMAWNSSYRGQKPSGTRGCNRPLVLRTATL